ncbi:MAG: dUTP diphosphatase [candidate division WOR-3 bacterium]|nr:MAG: dUTP diphosphatase [candidate division WOR-3 bacterium]
MARGGTRLTGIRVKIKGECIPRYQSEQAAGCDLHACLAQSMVIQPREYCTIPTGISVEIPEGYEGQVRPRSGLAAEYGIGVLNTPGTIDADYRGEIKVILFNFGHKPFVVGNGDRIAQLVFNKIERVSFEVVEDLERTKRHSGGFGHTGR